MCDVRKTRGAKKVWNQWLDERDQAPGEVLAEWLRQKAAEGLGAAAEYARAGLTLAQARVDQASVGRALLDEGGETAAEAIRTKQLCSQTLAADEDVIQRLDYYVSFYQEEASFSTDPHLRAVYQARLTRYRAALELLGSTKRPKEPLLSAEEWDASAILQFREAREKMGQALSFMSLPDTSTPASGSTSNRASTSSNSLPTSARGPRAPAVRLDRIEGLIAELFRLHDLNDNGVLEEEELIKLNQKIALLHQGKDANKAAVREKFHNIFHQELSPDGQPCGFSVFRRYMQKLLKEFDADLGAQEMILEQFVVEAESGRAAFRYPSLGSPSDAPFLSYIPMTGSTSRVSSQSSTPAVAAAGYVVPAPSRGSSYAISAPVPSVPGRPTGYQPDERTQLPLADRLGHTQAAGQGVSSTKSVSAATRQQVSEASRGTEARPAVVERLLTGPPERRQHPTSAQPTAEVTAQGYVKGNLIQVWSNCKGVWMDGIVEEAFSEACESEGYAVPAGSLKVSSVAGLKWILPGKAPAAIRRRPLGL